MSLSSPLPLAVFANAPLDIWEIIIEVVHNARQAEARNFGLVCAAPSSDSLTSYLTHLSTQGWHIFTVNVDKNPSTWFRIQNRR